jgi:hypothetical protein
LLIRILDHFQWSGLKGSNKNRIVAWSRCYINYSPLSVLLSAQWNHSSGSHLILKSEIHIFVPIPTVLYDYNFQKSHLFSIPTKTRPIRSSSIIHNTNTTTHDFFPKHHHYHHRHPLFLSSTNLSSLSTHQSLQPAAQQDCLPPKHH